MAIQTRNKLSVNFSMVSMSDIVFLLLIFFMLTSTLVAPNAIKLLLPSSESKTMAKQTLTVYINDHYQYFIEEHHVEELDLEPALFQMLHDEVEATIVLRSDKTVPVQYVVTLIDAINAINNKTGQKHKMILATSPKK